MLPKIHATQTATLSTSFLLLSRAVIAADRPPPPPPPPPPPAIPSYLDMFLTQPPLTAIRLDALEEKANGGGCIRKFDIEMLSQRGGITFRDVEWEVRERGGFDMADDRTLVIRIHFAAEEWHGEIGRAELPGMGKEDSENGRALGSDEDEESDEDGMAVGKTHTEDDDKAGGSYRGG